jgi:L-ascorbate metabolism protein UlaG (beta-lactamase superfamily)
MTIRITYLFHNSFLLEDGPTALLFDLPAERFLTPAIREVLQKTIAGKELYCFASHSHSDHFYPGLPELTATARQTRFILAAEIGKAFPQVNQWPEVSLIADDQTLAVGDLSIKAFPSNDLGVAFLIEMNEWCIYFGGDLANWNWDDFSLAEHDLSLPKNVAGTLRRPYRHRLSKYRPAPAQLGRRR